MDFRIKCIFKLAAAASLVFLPYSCKRETAAPVAVQGRGITISEASLLIRADGGTASFTVKAVKTFSVTSDREWCSVSVNDSLVTVTAEANRDLRPRYSSIAVATDSDSTRITIQQMGMRSTSFEPKDISSPARGGVYTFNYDYPDAIRAVASEDWIGVEVSEGVLTVSLAENTVPGVKGDRFREGEVSWTLGVDSGTIHVKQFKGGFLEPNESWSLSYEGIRMQAKVEYDVVRNTVSDGGASGSYGLHVFSASEVEASGLDLLEYLEVYAIDGFLEKTDSLIEERRHSGVLEPFASYLDSGTAERMFSGIEAGNWYMAAIGFGEDGEPTGYYAVETFAKKGSVEHGYDSWIGEWSVPRGNMTDTWVISEKVRGQTYNVTGIEDLMEDIVFEAEYVPSTKCLAIYSQTEVYVIEDPDGDMSVGLYGTFDGSGFMRGEYLILTARQSSDGRYAELIPENARLSSYTGPFETIRPIGYQETTGSYYVLTNGDGTPLPNTITRVINQTE